VGGQDVSSPGIIGKGPETLSAWQVHGLGLFGPAKIAENKEQPPTRPALLLTVSSLAKRVWEMNHFSRQPANNLFASAVNGYSHA